MPTPPMSNAAARHPATLIVSVGGVEILRREVTDSALIGRAVECDISVPEASLSRKHCRIDPPSTEEGTWQLVDLQSRNGTVINGRRVAASPLRHGDLIRVGRLLLWFGTESPAHVPALIGPAPGEGVVRPATPTAEPVSTTSAADHAARAVPGINLPQPAPSKAPGTVGLSDGEDAVSPSGLIAPEASSNLYAMVNPRPLPVPRPFPTPLVDEATIKANATVDEAHSENTGPEPGFLGRIFGNFGKKDR